MDQRSKEILARVWLTILTLLVVSVTLAQPTGHATLKLAVQPTSISVGGTGELLITATMSPGWHIYAVKNGEFVTKTAVSLKQGSSGLALTGPLVEPAYKSKRDEIINETINLHEGTVTFRQKFRVTAAEGTVRGTLVVDYQTCDETTCDPPMQLELPFEFMVTKTTSSAGEFQPATPTEVNPTEPAANNPATPIPTPSSPEMPPATGTTSSPEEVAQTEAKTGAVSWTARLEPPDPRPGEFARIVFTAQIDEGWHIYSPKNTTTDIFPISVELTGGGISAGELVVPDGVKKLDQTINAEVISYGGGVSIALPFQVPANASGSVSVPVALTYQACNQSICDMPTTVTWNLSATVTPGAPRSEFLAANTQVPSQPPNYESGEGDTGSSPEPAPTAQGNTPENDTSKPLLQYLLLAFVAGIAALATPCVFPMIPITVGYFSKHKAGENSKPNISGALAYALGIIGTFIILGMGMALIVGAAGAQWFAANPWVNIGLGILFLVLSLNLFGVYEIGLPSSWVNKAQTASRKQSGFIAPVLMGFAFTLTSFTCTVPFVGGILFAAANGEYIKPILGMLVFGIAFAAPFFLLALFPHYLNSLPRSGEWMVDVKKYLGFIEVAAALKFISNGELIWAPGILTREVYLAITATIFTIAAFWLFGWLRIGSESPKIGYARQAFGIVNILFAWFWFSGLNGANLGYLEAFPPGRDYSMIATQKEADIPWIEDYEEGQAKAQETGMPIFINFTGHTCVNCRRMEGGVFPTAQVRPLFDQVVPIELYTDKPSDPQERLNSEFLQKLTNQVANPTYVIMKPDGTVVDTFFGYAEGDAFGNWMRAAIEKAKA
ncbi:MAG: thioredoxin family protein [Fimbriimonadaceae bacterium]|nr:thioredoxin family protein [Fimbriimonadaceae bacterium]